MTTSEREREAAGQAVYRLLVRATLTKTLYTAIELGLPDDLAAGACSAADLAERRGYHPDRLHRVLRGLCELGVVSDDGERFALTDTGRALLTGETGRAAAAFMGLPITRDAWRRCADSVRTGEPGFNLAYGRGMFDHLHGNPEDLERFQAWMTARSRLQIPGILEAFDFATFSTVVDVGGGHGALLRAVLAAHPKLRGVLYDRPEVAAAATTVPFGDRLSIVGGSFFESVPPGGDCYLLKSVLHDWDDEAAERILRNVRAAMTDDAVVLVIEALLPDRGEHNEIAIFLDLHMMMLSENGRERDAAGFGRLLEAAGLTLDRIVSVDAFTNIICARPC